MAVAQEFIDVFIRIADVDRVYPGGMMGYLEDFSDLIGVTVWHDDHLLREGAMSSSDIESIVERWAKFGLETNRKKGKEPVEWLEVCVSTGISGQPTLPCSWIAYDIETGGAYLKGTAPGPLAWPQRRDGPEDEDEVWITDRTFETP